MSKDKIIAKLFRYLAELELQGGVCVFASISGHVNWIDIHITPNEQDPITRLGSWMVQYKDYYNGSEITAKELAKNLDVVLSEIKEITDNLQKANKIAEENKRLDELEQLRKLKEKYPNELSNNPTKEEV